MYSFQVYARMTCIFISTQCFSLISSIITRFVSACASWSNKIIDFDLSCNTSLLYTRVSEICARTSLIYVHSSSYIARSFSLTVNERKHIHFLFTSRDD
jgi:hypothetical protein